MKSSEITALIKLLDDDDKEVYQLVRKQLIDNPDDVLPLLKDYWDEEISAEHLNRIEQLEDEIFFNKVKNEIEKKSHSDVDFLPFLFQIALIFNHDLTFADLQKKIQKQKQTIWLELNVHQTFLEQLHVFNKVFYEVLGYKGDINAASISDFTIDTVLEKKQGSVIIVGLLYLILAKEVGIDLYGVCLKNYFILCASKAPLLGLELDKKDLSHFFYINPINKGIIFSKKEIEDYIKKTAIETKEEYFLPAENLRVCTEYLDYIITYLDYTSNFEKLTQVKILKKVLEKFL